YHFHFNYVDSAYNLAYYHYWQSLEISQFKDQSLLNEFLEILDEPDFDMVSKENIEIVANKVLEKDLKMIHQLNMLNQRNNES
ncbi:hypothetical protein DOS70_05155, partial [Staphylococcus felis]